ncbi:MAG: prolipoprotein diacylglyceryl transferase [Rhodospirillales bacterium]|nr:prolipoprotein diacylglyceryl transferase [Rhodospirillales bacterium]
MVIPYPAIDPVAIEIGPIAIRWYALAYLAGILLGWRMAARLAAQRPGMRPTPEDLDDFLVWAVLGVVLGGRLGMVLFYQPSTYFADPIQIIQVWKGGMSFHGGCLGVLIAIGLFSWRRHFDPLRLGDLMAVVAPIGLFFGRIANFINGELWGRPSDVPWAMIFPNDEAQLPRHPSQLYQAGLEGVVLFVLMQWAVRHSDWRDRPGLLGGVFLIGYGLARIVGELFREPDSYLGFFLAGTTMGQLLSVPMVLVGVALIVRARRRAPVRIQAA